MLAGKQAKPAQALSHAPLVVAHEHSRVKTTAAPGELENVSRRHDRRRQGAVGPDVRERFILHHAEGNGPRKPQIWNVDDSGDKLLLRGRYGS